jgi:hypothetical protein
MNTFIDCCYFIYIQVILKIIRRPLRTRYHGIGFVIVFEPFQYGIPIEFTIQFHGDVLQQAGGAGAVGNFRRSDVFLSGADAFQPVAVVVGTYI